MQLPRGTLAIYNPNDLVIKIRPQDTGLNGSLTDKPNRDFVATVTHEFWHAYYQQVVGQGYDPLTSQVLSDTATWLNSTTLLKSGGTETITGAGLSNVNDFVDEYVGAIINDLVGGPGGYVSIKQRLDNGEITPDRAQALWQQRVTYVKQDKIEAYEGAGEQVYEVQSGPPGVLVDHIVHLLGIGFPQTPGAVAVGANPPPLVRPPEVESITAEFSQSTFSTTYTSHARDINNETLTYTWSGPNCGGTSDATLSKFTWTHPHPPCDPTTDHADITIYLGVSNSVYTVICTYQGAASGTGDPCKPL
jgi:hypothetical protein